MDINTKTFLSTKVYPFVKKFDCGPPLFFLCDLVFAVFLLHGCY